jgi:hypothetical protein
VYVPVEAGMFAGRFGQLSHSQTAAGSKSTENGNRVGTIAQEQRDRRPITERPFNGLHVSDSDIGERDGGVEAAPLS